MSGFLLHSSYYIFYLQKTSLPSLARTLKLRLRVLGYFGIVGKQILSEDASYRDELVQYAEKSFLFLKNLTKHIRLYALAVRLQRELKVTRLMNVLKPAARQELVSLYQKRSLK